MGAEEFSFEKQFQCRTNCFHLLKEMLRNLPFQKNSLSAFPKIIVQTIALSERDLEVKWFQNVTKAIWRISFNL